MIRPARIFHSLDPLQGRQHDEEIGVIAGFGLHPESATLSLNRSQPDSPQNFTDAGPHAIRGGSGKSGIWALGELPIPGNAERRC